MEVPTKSSDNGAAQLPNEEVTTATQQSTASTEQNPTPSEQNAAQTEQNTAPSDSPSSSTGVTEAGTVTVFDYCMPYVSFSVYCKFCEFNCT